jgi:aspartyl protease family protein
MTAAGLATALTTPTTRADETLAVTLVGQIGAKALLGIGSAPPRALAVGQSLGRVRLVSFEGMQALVEVDGVRRSLRLGEPWPGPGAGNGPAEIVLKVGSGGHFHADARINGAPLRVIVDTGASFVALPVAEARRIGLPYADGPRVSLWTANGTTWGYQVRIDTVSLGDISVHGIDAVVQETLPFTLLGMSFLSRMTMRREGDTMTLARRF